MTIKELFETTDVPLRNRMVEKLKKMLSPPPIEQLKEFKKEWDLYNGVLGGENEFRLAELRKLKWCMYLETSQIGCDVRKAEGMSQITWDTEIIG